MISKTEITTTALERLKLLPVDHCLDLRTYKRNRSVLIVKKSAELFLVIEDGYFQEEFVVEFDKLKKLLKVLLKKEFPRSNKIRLYAMGVYDPTQAKENLRKVI